MSHAGTHAAVVPLPRLTELFWSDDPDEQAQQAKSALLRLPRPGVVR